MFRSNLLKSIQTLVLLLSIIGGVNVLVSITTLSPVFSTVSTSVDQGQLSEPSATNGRGSFLQQIEEFLAPSGYEQAREDPSYAINIPPTELGYSQFEPSDISIPANMGVVWFNDDDSQHSVTFNDTSPEAIDPGTIAPGGFFIHKFSTPGIYEYYDDQNPSAKGRINVGGEFESGQYMNMLVGGDALPFEAGKVGRTTFSFVPNDNVTTIPPSLSITYNVAIADSTGTELYSGQFDDSDGILDLELIPSSRSLSSSSSSSSNQTSTTTTASSNQTTSSSSSSSSNQTTASNFVTWGPDLTDQEGVASDGVYHVQGPVLTENEDYTITVSISSIDDVIQQQPPSDDFLLPSVNSTGTSLVPLVGDG
jgi:plastocyanin